MGDDAVKELAALADLHDEVDGLGVLVGLPEADEVGVARQRAHDLHLPAHVRHIRPAPDLALRDGLARERLAGLGVGAAARDAEFPPAELVPQPVSLQEVGARRCVEDGDGGGRARVKVVVVVVVVVSVGEAADALARVLLVAAGEGVGVRGDGVAASHSPLFPLPSSVSLALSQSLEEGVEERRTVSGAWFAGDGGIRLLAPFLVGLLTVGREHRQSLLHIIYLLFFYFLNLFS